MERQLPQQIETALTFDDVLLEPAASAVLPLQTKLSTELVTGSRLTMNIPLISAAMDTVTEAPMAIAVAQMGGFGVIHKNCSVQVQTEQVSQVKRFESGIVAEPICVSPETTVGEAKLIKQEKGYSGLPVIDKNGCVVGIVTNRDLRFETTLDQPITEVMTPRARLITVAPSTSLAKARALMHEHRIERVIVEDNKQRLRGLITIKDILLSTTFPDSCKDHNGSLRVGAAVGINDHERVAALVEAGVDVIVVDTAHGHSAGVIKWTGQLRRKYPKMLIAAGNIATAGAALALADAGADIVKIGVGPGSICTTRIIAGVGVPQFTAIRNVTAALAKRKKKVGIIGDGGLRYSGDIVKALAAGADAVMLGSLFAGTEETPSEIEMYQGRAYKGYRGMGSIGAMRKGTADRYFQQPNTEEHKLVAEGVEARVPYRGQVQDVVEQLVGGMRSAMGYVGAKTLKDLQKNAKFVQVTAAGVRESHVHDVQITKETPNYHID